MKLAKMKEDERVQAQDLPTPLGVSTRLEEVDFTKSNFSIEEEKKRLEKAMNDKIEAEKIRLQQLIFERNLAVAKFERPLMAAEEELSIEMMMLYRKGWLDVATQVLAYIFFAEIPLYLLCTDMKNSQPSQTFYAMMCPAKIFKNSCRGSCDGSPLS